MIYAILGILALGAVTAMWLFRRGKKEAKYETAEKTIEIAQAANDISKRVDGLSPDALERLRTDLNERD